MKRKPGRPKEPLPHRRGASAPAFEYPPHAVPHERLWVALLLVLHLALALWGAARNSVTFDENFHLPSGVMIVARGSFDYSVVNPPLIKALCAVPVLLLGAHLPTAEALADGEQGVVGESFMRVNAAHYHTLFFAARCVIVLLSVLLGWLVWRWARRLYGSRGALLSVAAYAFLPETLAHAGLATMDLATGLGFLASSYAFWKFLRTGRWVHGAWAALALGATFLIRFSAALLLPGFVALLAIGTATGWIRRPRRAWLGFALMAPVVLLLVNAGYLFHTSFLPLSLPLFESDTFHALGRALPGLRLPLPDSFLAGLDHQMYQSQAGHAHTYLFGRSYPHALWYYFPIALLVKWPLGFLGLVATRKVTWLAWRPVLRRLWNDACLTVPALVFAYYTMFFAHLNVGVRYLFPIVPVLCIWIGGLLAPARGRTRRTGATSRWTIAAAVLLLVLGVETATTAPWYLSFYNACAGGPGGGYRIVNDSNVDWGQGLIALRDELHRRGIGKIHLAYHGTVDPALYGIDYVPYTGGPVGPESDWLAVSSYYYVGLPQRMMTSQGRTPAMQIDLRSLWNRKPDATPAGCMFLFRRPDAAGGR